jgi:hypothetical protein
MTSLILAIIILWGLPSLLYILYLRSMVKNSDQIIRSISEEVKAEFRDTKIRFKNFDFYKKKERFNFDMNKSLYTYYRADIYLLENKIVVVGKSKILGKTIRLLPFAICNSEKISTETAIKYLTRHIKTELIDCSLEIEFEDAKYSNNIRIVIPRIGDKVYEKLKLSGFEALPKPQAFPNNP